MRQATKFLLVVLLIEVTVCGFFYYQKSNQPTPAVPNLASVDEITRADFESAIATCKSPEEWTELARIFMAHGFYPEANATFARACEKDPTSKELAYDYAFCLSRSGDFAESNRQFERALDLGDTRVLEANYFIGRNHLRGENSDAAEEAFRKSSDLPIAKFELAKILYRKGKLDEAEEWLKKSLRDEPDAPQALGLLSNVRLKKGDRVAALGDSLEASNYWSRIPTPFAQERERLMKIHAKIGYSKQLEDAIVRTNQMKHEEARKDLKRLQAIEWNPAAQESLIKCANQGRRLHVAVDLIRERIERFGQASTWYARLGETLLEIGETEEALEAWTKGAELNSDDNGKNCNRNLARFYIEQNGDLESSQKYQGIGIIGFSKEAMRYGKYLESLDFSKKATELDPQSAEAFFVYGKTLAGLGRMDAAIEAFKTSIKLDPTHGRSLMHLEAMGENPDHGSGD